MNKILIHIILFIYISLSTGMGINMHYCGGELESLKINTSPVKCCCGKPEMPKACCNDRLIVLELNVDQNYSVNSYTIPGVIEFTTFIVPGLTVFNDYIVEDKITSNYHIPPPKKEHTRIFNCSLTYYG